MVVHWQPPLFYRPLAHPNSCLDVQLLYFLRWRYCLLDIIAATNSRNHSPWLHILHVVYRSLLSFAEDEAMCWILLVIMLERVDHREGAVDFRALGIPLWIRRLRYSFSAQGGCYIFLKSPLVPPLLLPPDYLAPLKFAYFFTYSLFSQKRDSISGCE